MMGAETNHLTVLRLILCLCLVLCKSSSSARPLTTEKDSTVTGSCSGGEEMGSCGNYKKYYRMMEAAAIQGKLGGIFGALVMNVLPKGATPPSGPSRRNNGLQT
ncbi:hypothetical protein ACH5RR_019453 [Cinchona calisaya]|uniref:Uncharacterized protein n=1 Tax=Cinchona calisaya TaxID=153742 RepID=A0ABD2ZPL5_9GENT